VLSRTRSIIGKGRAKKVGRGKAGQEVGKGREEQRAVLLELPEQNWGSDV